MSENGLPKPAILSPFFLQCFCFKLPGAPNDAWISLKKKLFDCVWTCWKWQEKLEVIHRGRLHEENHCMFYQNFKKSLKVCDIFTDYRSENKIHSVASWVHCVVTVRLCSNISNLYSTCSGPVFWMLPFSFYFLFAAFGLKAWPHSVLYIKGPLIQVHLPISWPPLRPLVYALLSLSDLPPFYHFPLLSIMPSCALPLPWPIEGRMRKMERTNLAPHGAVCTITCTAFTCPVSTAVAPATVAKLACPLQPTLSAMPPSLNTCELASTASWRLAGLI